MKLSSLLLAAAPFVAVWLVAPGKSKNNQRAPFMGLNVAHRGLHTADRSRPENSLAAFETAAAAGYGIELDVQLSREGEVVVFHDDTLDRVCGVHGRVDAFTLAQLQGMRLCGTDQTIPTFAQVLQLLDIAPRPLVEREKKYIADWDQMGFDDETIREAYERTIVKKQSLDWNYMNGILRRWHEKGLHTLAAVREGDHDVRPVQAASPQGQDRAPAGQEEQTRADMERMRRLLERIKGEE